MHGVRFFRLLVMGTFVLAGLAAPLVVGAPARAEAPTVLSFGDLGVPVCGWVALNSPTIQGVTFSNVTAIWHCSSTGFPHSAAVHLEACFGSGFEFCDAPIAATFMGLQTRVKVWVGYSATLSQSITVRMTAFDADHNPVGTADATLPANPTVSPIRTPLEVEVDTPTIQSVEVSIPGGSTFFLAIDDLEFESAGGCPLEQPSIVEIPEADAEDDDPLHDCMRRCLVKAVRLSNTTVLLGPDVTLDFSGTNRAFTGPEDVNGVSVGFTDVEGVPLKAASSPPECDPAGPECRYVPQPPHEHLRNHEPELPLMFGPCVTLTSASTFPADTTAPRLSCEDILSVEERDVLCPNADLDPSTPAPEPDLAGSVIDVPPARTPQSLGPLLNFGPHRDQNNDGTLTEEDDIEFLLIRSWNDGVVPASDHVRISGFRIHGPFFGIQNPAHETGILIDRSLDIEISNMEVAGWGGIGIRVRDRELEPGEEHKHDPADGPGQVPPSNLTGERIGRPAQIRIFRNFIHHNQHPRTESNDKTAGYGVEVIEGAWAQIYENLFDFNRHAIAASGSMGGYEALRNLVLKGGGVHQVVPVGRTLGGRGGALAGALGGLLGGDPVGAALGWVVGSVVGSELGGVLLPFAITAHTHQFDIHGTGENGAGGKTGVRSVFAGNSFQYWPPAITVPPNIDLDTPAIEIRGTPHESIHIRDNIFAHEGLENDEGDDAIHLETRDFDVIHLGPNNDKGFDSYGRYGVCDFDGDGVDDLFLATGRTWWFSSFGEFPWSYLNARTERLDQVRLGYFDDDTRCDVLTESSGEWVIASGGTGEPKSIGTFGETAGEPSPPLSEVVFGRFDPSIRDHRPGVTRRTTDAFWRKESGEWVVRSLSKPDPDPDGWQHAQSSSKPFSELRFGDFTGDGVTDVLAVESKRWAISESARGSWRRLNSSLSDDVSSLLIADLDHNNIDDLIRLGTASSSVGSQVVDASSVVCGAAGVFGSVAAGVFGPVATGVFGLGCRGSANAALSWWVSDDGRSRWRRLKTYAGADLPGGLEPVFGYAGRFGRAPGGGVLLIGRDRIGRFYSEAELAADPPASPDWTSVWLDGDTFHY